MRRAEPSSSLLTSCTSFLLFVNTPLLDSMAEVGVPLWPLREELRLSLFKVEDDPVVSRLTLITPSSGLLKDVSVIDMELVSASL